LASQWGGSLIDVSGGSSGSVNGTWIHGNILSNDVGQPSMIGQDNHSYNVSIGNSSALKATPAGFLIVAIQP
jgi:hypothetical protein